MGAAMVAAVMKMTPVPAPVPAPVTAIGVADRATQMVHKLLTKHFDEDKGLYESDWDDERVARESGAQLAFVESIRRSLYKELAESPEVTAVRREAGELKARLAVLEERIEGMSGNTPQKGKRLSIKEEARLVAEQALDDIKKGRFS